MEPRHLEQNRRVGWPYNPLVPNSGRHGWRRGQVRWHLIKTQWHDKTEASRGGENTESLYALGNLPTLPEPGEKPEV